MAPRPQPPSVAATTLASLAALAALALHASSASASAAYPLPWSTSTTAAPRKTYVQTQLNAYNGGLSASLRSEKYASMQTDVFSFFRGTDHLFMVDVATSPSLSLFGGVAGTRTVLSGDAHCNNVGAYSDDTGKVIYDVNDWDESVIADYQLDVWRMATSIALMLQVNGLTSLQSTVLDSFSGKYAETVSSYAGNSGETSFMLKSSNTYGLLNDFLAATESSDSVSKLLKKYTTNSGARKFDLTNSDLASVTSTEKSSVTSCISWYAQNTLAGGISYSKAHFTVKDVAQRLHAGIGSLGVKRFYALIEGPSSGDSDDVILDVKAQSDTPAAMLRLDSASISATNTMSAGNPARRTIKALRAMTLNSDDYAGWCQIGTYWYSIRQRNPYKETFDTTTITTQTQAQKMAEQWGILLATAHARADKDSGASGLTTNFDTTLQSLLSSDSPSYTAFKKRVRDIALPYAVQVNYDFQSFLSLLAANSLASTMPVGVTDADAYASPLDGVSDADAVPAIVGGVVGGLVAVLGAALAAVGIRRRRSRIETQAARAAVAKEVEANSVVPTQAQLGDGDALSSPNPMFQDAAARKHAPGGRVVSAFSSVLAGARNSFNVARSSARSTAGSVAAAEAAAPASTTTNAAAAVAAPGSKAIDV